MTRRLAAAALLAFGLGSSTSAEAKELRASDQQHFETRWRKLSAALAECEGNGLRAQQLWEGIFVERDAVAGAAMLLRWRGTLRSVRLATIADSGFSILGEIALSDSDPSEPVAEVTPHVVRFALPRGRSERLEAALGALRIGQTVEFSACMHGEWETLGERRAAETARVSAPPSPEPLQRPSYLELVGKAIKTHFDGRARAAELPNRTAPRPRLRLREAFAAPRDPSALVFEVELRAIRPLLMRRALLEEHARLVATCARLDSLSEDLHERAYDAFVGIKHLWLSHQAPENQAEIRDLVEALYGSYYWKPRPHLTSRLEDAASAIPSEESGLRFPETASQTMAAVGEEVRALEATFRKERGERLRLIARASALVANAARRAGASPGRTSR